MVNKRIRVIAALMAMGVVISASNFNSSASSASKSQQEVVDIVYNEQIPLADEATGDVEILKSVDNSQNKYFPPIIQQGTYNSCASWAMTYYQTSYEFNKAQDKDGSLPENQLSPVFTYNLTNNGNNEGTYFTDVAKVLKEVGSVSMAQLPADTVNGDMPIGDISADANIWRAAHLNRIEDFVQVSDGDADRMGNATPITSPDDEDLLEIKKALCEGYVLTASTPGNKWKYKTIESNVQVPANEAYVGQQIMTLCDREGYKGHRITIVGYNDEIWADINENNIVDEGEKGAFKIANTRGTDYGNDGYMWISYDTLNIISSVYSNSAIDLGFENREPSLVDIGYVIVNGNQQASPVTLEFEAKTASAKGMGVVITATEKEGNRNLSVYTAAPFKRAVEIGLGEKGFDGSFNETTGSFSIALDNLFSDIKVEDLDKYEWNVKVSNTNKDVPITYSNIKFVDADQNVLYEAAESEYVIDSTEKFVKLEKAE
ncbi:MAG: hypothetical protein E7262_08010 [Lachnospiraceae bacterium]|nr:hypothetical protein [Lachnospiraceae bacterium]